MPPQLVALACGVVSLALFPGFGSILEARTTVPAAIGRSVSQDTPRQVPSPEEAAPLAQLKEALARGVSPDEAGEDGFTRLMWGSLRGFESCVDILLAAGADPNRQDRNGTTALMQAVPNNHVGIVKRLLEHGANPNLGNTDLLASAVEISCNPDVVRLLLEHGVSISGRNSFGQSPLSIATTKLKSMQGTREPRWHGLAPGMDQIVQMLKAAGLTEEKPARQARQVAPAHVKPVSEEALKSLLPELSGWQRTQVTTGGPSSLGFDGTRASCHYQKGTAEIHLVIDDSGNNDEDRAVFAALLKEIDSAKPEQTPNESTKRVTIRGCPGFEQVNRDTDYGLVSVKVADRFNVLAQGGGTHVAELRQLIEAIDLARLAKMK